MDSTLNVILPVLLYIFGIILLIVLIVLGIRLIVMLEKVDRLVDNVEDKVNSLNGAFALIDKTTDSIALISDSIVNAIAGLIHKLVGKKNKNKKKKEESIYE